MIHLDYALSTRSFSAPDNLTELTRWPAILQHGHSRSGAKRRRCRGPNGVYARNRSSADLRIAWTRWCSRGLESPPAKVSVSYETTPHKADLTAPSVVPSVLLATRETGPKMARRPVTPSPPRGIPNPTVPASSTRSERVPITRPFRLLIGGLSRLLAQVSGQKAGILRSCGLASFARAGARARHRT